MRHEYANVNGIRMHYVTAGEGEPVLLLHGFPEYWGVWKRVMADLARDHRVIAPDLRGFNETSRPADVEQYRIPHLVADVRALVEHLGLERRLNVVAQDWGAVVGWGLVLRHPGYVRRFVTIDITHPALFDRDLREDPRQQEASRYMLSFRSPRAEERLAADDFAARRESIFGVARRHGAELSEQDIEEWVDTWRKPGATTAGLNYYRAARIGPPDDRGSPGGSNLLEDVPPDRLRVSIPVLVLWAEEDPFLLDCGLVGLEDLVPGVTVERIPGATHWLTLEKPLRVSRYVRDFLARAG